MNHGLIYRFLVRWLVCSLGLWLSASLLGSRLISGDSLRISLVAGLLLAVVNSVIRPIVVILSLPAILFTLGLFMVVINGFTVLIVSWLYKPLAIANFWVAILAGIIIGSVNYLVTTVLENQER